MSSEGYYRPGYEVGVIGEGGDDTPPPSPLPIALLYMAHTVFLTLHMKFNSAQAARVYPKAFCRPSAPRYRSLSRE